MKKEKNLIGSWAFVVGIILAIIIALFGVINSTLVWILVVIGIIVGLVNIGDEEVEPFLFSGIALILATSFGQQVLDTAPILTRILNAMLIVFVPATIIVALKNVFSMARR